MIKFNSLMRSNIKVGSTPEDILAFENETKIISGNVYRALISHFKEKSKIPESTTITIKVENGNVNIVVS